MGLFRMILVHFQDKTFNITVIQVYAPTTNSKEVKAKQYYIDQLNLLELTLKKKNALFIIRNLNAKGEGQEIPGVIDKFGLGVQSESGQGLTEFCQENTLAIANTLFQKHKRQIYTRTSPWSISKSLIAFFATKDGEALHSQQKQVLGLTVTPIMSSLLQN